MNPQLSIDGKEIRIQRVGEENYICLTDMTKGFDGGSGLIEKWLSNKSTVEFLGAYEKLNNENFKTPEFGGFKNQAGSNSFFLSTKKWVEVTSAIGIVAKAGKYGGTFASEDIATHFGQWLSPEFSLYVISEFRKLKKLEAERNSEDWKLNRALSKINYQLHTDAIQEHLLPPHYKKGSFRVGVLFASEADILNIAMFGMTAKEWKKQNSEESKKMNMRDRATTMQLLVLSQLEVANSLMIKAGENPQKRLEKLNAMAIENMARLLKNPSLKNLK